jgi:hypothetical protein
VTPIQFPPAAGSFRRETLSGDFHPSSLKADKGVLGLSLPSRLGLGRLSAVAMVQAIDQGQFDDVSLVGRFDGPRLWAVLIQCPVRAMSMVIRQIVGQDPMQMPSVEDDHVIQTLPANGADEPFDHWIGIDHAYPVG